MDRSKHLVIGAVIGALAFSTVTALGQTPTFPEKPISDEYLLIGDATRGSGEAQLVVDPTNPDNILAVGMGTLQFRPGCPVPDVQCTSGQGIPKPPFSTLPSSVVTHDGGRTWKHFDLPILEGGYVRCPDPFVGATKDGTLLAGCEPAARTGQYAKDSPEPMPLATGETAIVVSADKGETWSKRVDGINTYGKPPSLTWAPNLKPHLNAGTAAYDRPWLWFDDKTDTVYLSSLNGQTDIDTGKPGVYRTQTYFTVSHDKGRSFGTIQALDAPDWPQVGRMTLAAGVGSFLGVYPASKVPASENAKCPCHVLAISYDQGRTFSRHVLQNLPVAPNPQAGEDRVQIAADPTTAKRLSLMRYVARPTPRFEFATSNDDGKTWSAFKAVGGIPDAVNFVKPNVKYSRWGVLAVVWKAEYRDLTFDLWSVVSKDGGRTFSAPLRISHARSVPRPYYRAVDNDDNNGLDMSQTDLFTVWGDSRAGFQGSWFGKVSLSSYK